MPDNPARTPPASREHLLLLKWLLLAVAVGLGAAAALHLGLWRQLLAADRTRLTLAILALFLAAAGHGGLQVLRLSRALNHAAKLEQWLVGRQRAQVRLALSRPDPLGGPPAGPITDHIGMVARGGAGGRQALLDAFAARLGRGCGLGWFAADLLLSLGLLGTVIGFISMLAPLAGLDGGDAAAMKEALAAMSAGMAVALYTTLAGLGGGILLRLQGYLLDDAQAELLRRTTLLTEAHVLPALAQEAADAA